MTDSDGTTIRVENLVKRFGDFTAVDGLNFEVHRGEIFGFLGPNGSGKTTTIRMMLGLLAPTKGRAWVLGSPVDEDPRSLRWQVGYMAQRFSLYNDLTVAQNLRFYGQAYGLAGDPLKRRMEEVLELAGLKGREGERTDHLSGGWRQRLALGAAIIHQPEVVFLDEPTAGVDPVSRREFWELLYRMVEEGITVFVTTHYMDEAEHCQRLGFLQRGELIALGSPAEIKREVMKGAVIEIQAEENEPVFTALRQAASQSDYPMEHLELYGNVIHVLLSEDGYAVDRTRKILDRASVQYQRVESIEPSLEDVFIACMK